jgi:hypothetical protein
MRRHRQHNQRQKQQREAASASSLSDFERYDLNANINNSFKIDGSNHDASETSLTVAETTSHAGSILSFSVVSSAHGPQQNYPRRTLKDPRATAYQQSFARTNTTLQSLNTLQTPRDPYYYSFDSYAYAYAAEEADEDDANWKPSATGPIDVDECKPIVDVIENCTSSGPVDLDNSGLLEGDDDDDVVPEMYYCANDDCCDEYERQLMGYEIGFEPHVIVQVSDMVPDTNNMLLLGINNHRNHLVRNKYSAKAGSIAERGLVSKHPQLNSLRPPDGGGKFLV